MGSHITEAGPEISMKPMMTLTFWSSCLHLPSARITGVYHHAWLMQPKRLDPGHHAG